MKADHISELIGNTPVLRIDPAVHRLRNIDVYAKLEYFNPFGSLKDRIAWAMLKDDLDAIRRDGRTVLESSSGNTAKALQALCSSFGIPFKTVTNRVNVQEVRDILTILGTDLQELPGRSECPDPSDPDNPLAVIDRLLSAEPDRYFHTSQYVNEKNPAAHYATTGQELIDDLGRIDFFAGGLGTTGSTRGTAEHLREVCPDLYCIGVIAAAGDLIPGIRTEAELFEVGLFERELYDDIMGVTSEEGIDAMLTLIRRCGILSGPTTGATFVGMLRALQPLDAKLTERKTAVFIACDRMEWYVSYIRKRRPALFGEKAGPTTAVSDADIAATPSVGVTEATDWIQREQPLVVDIRSQAAYRVAHVEGSLNIPQDALRAMLERGSPFPADKPVLVICPIGDQSRRIAAMARRHGSAASSLEGGITAWRDAGLPLTRQRSVPIA